MATENNNGLKLTGANWPFWKFQTFIALKEPELFQIIDGTNLQPSSEGEAQSG